MAATPAQRILISGCDGQVGWELQRTLSRLGEVIAVNRTQMDLAMPDAIRTCVRAHRPSLIVNAAAYTAVDRAESEPEAAQAINATAVAVLAEEARQIGAAMIHYSTDYVFDGSQPAPYVESDATHPLSVYGKTKLAGEEALAGAGIPYLTLRTSWVYGARGRNFLLTILKLAAERPELRIVAGLSGWPWVNDMVALLRRHPNLYCDTAAHRPRHFATPGSGWEQFLQFGNTLNQDKVMVGLSWLLLGNSMENIIAEYLELPLKDSVKEKWLYQNALHFFQMD